MTHNRASPRVWHILWQWYLKNWETSRTFALTFDLRRVMGYWASWVFTTSSCNQDECDLYALHSNAEPLSFNKEDSWAYSVQSSSVWRCVQALLMIREKSCETTWPCISPQHNLTKCCTHRCVYREMHAPMHTQWCVCPFSVAIFAVVSVSNLICTILYPTPSWPQTGCHGWIATVEGGRYRESRLRGIMQNEKEGGGRMQREKEIKRGRINSEKKETERAGVGEWNKWISSGGH